MSVCALLALSTLGILSKTIPMDRMDVSETSLKLGYTYFVNLPPNHHSAPPPPFFN